MGKYTDRARGEGWEGKMPLRSLIWGPVEGLEGGCEVGAQGEETWVLPLLAADVGLASRSTYGFCSSEGKSNKTYF